MRKEELINIVKRNSKKMRIVAAAVVVVVAVLFFLYPQSGENESDYITDGQETETIDVENSLEDPVSYYVDISGEVNNPGVYELDEGSRVFQVIEKAGGLTSNADTRTINRADIITDGQKIYIPSADEVKETSVSNGTVDSQGKININTADATALEEIPGVGPATAGKIIDYRTTEGNFSSIEDIKNVSGIGDKTFEKMKDKITV